MKSDSAIELETLRQSVMEMRVETEWTPIVPPSTEVWKQVTLFMCVKLLKHFVKIHDLSIELGKQLAEASRSLALLEKMEVEAGTSHKKAIDYDDNIFVCKSTVEHINASQASTQPLTPIEEIRRDFDEWIT